jgi:hypothetical protein
MNETGDLLFLTSEDVDLGRTEWDIKFMSKSFVENLGDKLIDDQMKILSV